MTSKRVGAVLAIGLGVLLSASYSFADDPEITSVPEPQNEGGLQGTLRATINDRFHVHGHLTVAYTKRSGADTDKLFAEERILGITEDGKLNHLLAAVQMRFDATERHSFVLQVNHRSLGESVLDESSDDLGLDWLYWSREIGDRTLLRLGRFPTPAGIFNEIRDVGTLLPFFRPAFTFYREGAIFSETVDGVGLWHTFGLGRGFELEGAVYGGRFDVLEQNQGFASEDEAVAEVSVDESIGGQLWLTTPLEGLSLGVGVLEWKMGAESQYNSENTTWKSWYASVDGAFERWQARAEYRRLKLPIDTAPVFFDGEGLVDLYYWQLGWLPTARLGLYVQSEYADFEQRFPGFVDGGFRMNNRRDEGVAVRLTFGNRGYALRAEYHRQRFDQASAEPVFTSQGLLFQASTEEFASDYMILSSSFSF